MKCKNKITVAYYNNGRITIEGSAEIIRPRIMKYDLHKKINGHFKDETCNGEIVISISANAIDNSEFCEGEIVITAQCDRCGKIYPAPSKEQVESWAIAVYKTHE